MLCRKLHTELSSLLTPQTIAREELPVQALARLEFGEHLLSVLGLAGSVKLKIAKNLPPVATNDNAFRNSYLWDMSTGVLHLHGKRAVKSLLALLNWPTNQDHGPIARGIDRLLFLYLAAKNPKLDQPIA